jgi:predicted nucleotidyltransferase
MRKKSYGTVKIKSLDRAKAIKKLKRIARDIMREDPNVMEVSLFGSLAKGNYTGGSDADILIVLGEDSRRFMDRIPPYLAPFLDTDLPVDVFPYTSIELEELGKGKNPFIKRIQDEKIILTKSRAS